MTRPDWDFDYRPIPGTTVGEEPLFDDLIVATEQDIDPAQLVTLLGSLSESIHAETVLSSYPLFWTRVRAGRPLARQACEQALRKGGIAVRYVASVRVGSQELPPRLGLGQALPKRATRWPARSPADHDEHSTPGRWFLEPLGVDVTRSICGTGAGTRLAVIDNDAGHVEDLELDAEILVGVQQPPRGSGHGPQLLAWATRARSFCGVAPDASARLYFIPKPDGEVLSLPLAIARAVDDGADVVLCATHVDGQVSPMLDDALEVASRLGRGGRGCAVVMPCSREPSSPGGSVHSSFSLGLGEPAADPRVFCVGPSSRGGGWFLWRDRHGRLHPFANRGPSLRWLAPGDDLAWPFQWPERLAHAESSGASALAAGVLLLVLGQNPELTLPELDAAVSSTAVDPTEVLPEDLMALADRADVLPRATDRDGHNAKHGYGRMSATRACLLVSDPVAAALVMMGEDCAAEAWHASRPPHFGWFPSEASRWAARTMLLDAGARHAASAVARTLRLVAGCPDRMEAQIPGALLRQVGLLLRTLVGSRTAPAPGPAVLEQLAGLESAMASTQGNPDLPTRLHGELRALAVELWPAARPASEVVSYPDADQIPAEERLRA